MDTVDIILRLMGAFYVFAGYVAARATLTGMLVDRAIAALDAKPLPLREALHGLAMLLLTALVLLSGAALLLQLKWALPLFLACCLFQPIYLFVIAPKELDTGRRQSINALIIYIIATVFVVWAFGQGRLYDSADVNQLALAAVSTAVAAHLGYFTYQAVKIMRMPRVPAGD